MAAPRLAPGARAVEADRRRTASSGSPGMPRVDIPAKVTGTYAYVQNLRVPGMLHGRIVRPRGQGAYGDGHARRRSSRSTRARSPGIGDARVVRRGDFLGVVASREYDAIQAAARLKVVYARPPDGSPGAGISAPRCARSTRPVRLRRASSSTPAMSTLRSRRPRTP